MDNKKNMRQEVRIQPSAAVKAERNHSLSIDNRKKMILTGVLDVESFNDQEIVLETVLGMLTVKGVSMHMNRLNLETGDLVIDGELNSCAYSVKQDFKTKGAGFLSKMFK